MLRNIEMTVNCVGEECIGCPELEITVERMTLTSCSSAINHLYCTKRRRCERLKDFLQREMNKKEDKDKQDGEHEQ